jgi:mannose-6-phosphate isomerase-like protein (cupin superfamily)
MEMVTNLTTNIMPTEIQFDVLEPETFNVFLVSQLAPGTFIDGLAGLDFVVIPKHSTSEIHRHDFSDNLVYITSGHAEVFLNGERHDIHPKMRIVIPKTVSHGFRTAAEQLEFISIQVPPILDKSMNVFDRVVE